MDERLPPTPDLLADPRRLEALSRSQLLGRRPEAVLDRLTRLARRLIGTPVAAVSFVTADQQLFASAVGLPAAFSVTRETPVSHSFCQHVVRSNRELVIDDARKHPVVCDSPAIRDLNVVAYAGVPLTLSDGRTLGSFCAMDSEPRRWSEEDLAGLRDLAALAIAEIETRVRAAEAAEARAALQRIEMGLRESQREVLERLAQAAELRDDDTGLHTRRVGIMSARIAAALRLPTEQVELLRHAAPLHDVGKIGVPDTILRKQGRLTAEERACMQQHALEGARILSGSRSPLTRLAEVIALSHHERWDGAGYPYRVPGEAIPIAARIVSVADVFDALSYDRPYRKAWPHERVVSHIRDAAGTQFDPRVVSAFLEVEIAMADEFPDE